MSDTVYRLLGPNHNRLVTVIDTQKHLPGQVSTAAAKNLKDCGWRPYAGTAQTKAGWVIPGTDPALRPRALKAN